MTRMASVPRWVLQHSPAAVKLYALLDIEDGKLSVKDAAFYSDMAPSTVTRALKELRDSGAIRRIKNAHYEIRRENQLSTDSTELSPTDQHADPQAHALSAERSLVLSTEREGTTTTTRHQGEKTSGVNPSDSQRPAVKSFLPPKRVLVDGRYLAFDALSIECNADPRSRTGEITKALKQIRQYAWDAFTGLARSFDYEPHQFEQYVADEIKARAGLYRNRMRGATLTPTALAKWWFDLEKLPERGLTPDEIASGSWRDS